MRRIFILVSLCFSFLVGCNDSLTDTLMETPIEPTNYVSIDETGFLVFKDQNAYNQISVLLDEMNDQDFLNWEKSIGFISAQTFINNVYNELEKIESLSEYETFKHKYSNELIFSDEGDIDLPFYSTGWQRVLDIEGIMKIGNVLYKFDKEKEIAIADGNYDDIHKFEIGELNDDKVKVFHPFKDNLLKSVQEGTHSYPTLYSDNGKSKLDYSLQMISFYYTGYGYTTTYYTEVGYQFKLNMLQKRKNFLGGWYKNKTVYFLDDIHLYYQYNEIGEIFPIYPNPIYVLGESVEFNDDINDKTSSETNNGYTWNILYYYDYKTGEHPQTNLRINDLDVTVYSRGIGTSNAGTISNYSNF